MTTTTETLLDWWGAYDTRHAAITTVLDTALRSLRISAIQARIVLMLAEQGDQMVSAVGKAIGRAPGTMTPMVDRLVEADLVERVRTPADRRVVLLTLTNKGLALAPIMQRMMTRTLAELLGDATPSHLDMAAQEAVR